MSTMQLVNVKHPSSASNNIVLDSSGNATIANDLSVTGDAAVTGDATIDGDLKFNSGYGSVATAYGCRAWVNFDGTGTVAIRASGNVTSITDNNTADYTVNLTTAMPDANYAVTASVGGTSNVFLLRTAEELTARTSSAFRIRTGSTTDNLDAAQVNVAIFR